MTLIPKNSILNYINQSFHLGGNSQGTVANLLLVFLYLYALLQLKPKIAVAESPTIQETTPKLLSVTGEVCNNNFGSYQGISLLASTSVEISTWLNDPQIGVKALIQTFGSHFLNYLSLGSLSQSQLDPQLDSQLDLAIAQIWQKSVLPLLNPGFNFRNPVVRTQTTINNISLILISGGKPITIHADSRYQLPEILAKSGTQAVAAVDGTFFSLKFLTSNVMIGPVLNQINNQFIPGNNSENKKLTGRPLVLISQHAVRYLSFDPDKHNTLGGLQAEMSDVTDAFVAGAWLVKNAQPQEPSTFKNLYGADVARHRAFWGINPTGIPTIGVSTKPVDSANLAIILAKAGLREAVMLDSGASTSLTYQGESLVDYTPRPVPHAVALVPSHPTTNIASCMLMVNKTKNRGT
jgi:Phosphodiester glycosidase